MVPKESFGDRSTKSMLIGTLTKGTRDHANYPDNAPDLPRPGAWPHARRCAGSLFEQLKLLHVRSGGDHFGRRAVIGRVVSGILLLRDVERLGRHHRRDHDQLE